jgi:hypothetical protein
VILQRFAGAGKPLGAYAEGFLGVRSGSWSGSRRGIEKGSSAAREGGRRPGKKN